jgi:hypothetical protein
VELNNTSDASYGTVVTASKVLRMFHYFCLWTVQCNTLHKLYLHYPIHMNQKILFKSEMFNSIHLSQKSNQQS